MNLKKKVNKRVNNTKKVFKKGTDKVKSFAGKGKKFVDKKAEEAFKVLDQNGDGKIDLMDLVTLALRTPGINVNREEFIKNALQNKYPKEVVYDAVKYNPMHANVEYHDVESIADESIEFERRCATSGSAVLGIPGGLAVTATLPIDIIQYFAFLLRAAQKLMYIYGYGDLNIKEGKKLDESTMQVLELCLGVMLGVQGADTAFRAAMPALSETLALTLKASKNLIVKFPMFWAVKGISFFIPLLGGLVSGGVTYVMFKPSCNRLKKLLRENPLNSNGKASKNAKKNMKKK